MAKVTKLELVRMLQEIACRLSDTAGNLCEGCGDCAEDPEIRKTCGIGQDLEASGRARKLIKKVLADAKKK